MEKSNVKHCVMGILKIKSCFTELKLEVEDALVNTYTGLG